LEDGSTSAAARRRRWSSVAALAAGILLGAAVVTVGTFISGRSENRETTRLSFQIPPTQRLVDSFFAVTPDGRTIAYSAVEKNRGDGDWIRQLYLRSLDSYGTTVVEGSEGIAGPPAFSSDGKQIAWIAPLPTNPALHLIAVQVTLEAPPRVIGKWPQDGARSPSMAWLADGSIVTVIRNPYAVFQFPSDGGPPASPIELRGLGINDLEPLGGAVLPDGKTILAEAYIVEENSSRVSAVTIDTRSGETSIAAEDARWPVWSPTGHLLFRTRNVLMANRFDPKRIAAIGGRTTILEATDRFVLSASGTLVYRSGAAGETARRIATFGAAKDAEYWSEDRRAFRRLSVSPDGRRVAVRLGDPEKWDWQIWTSDIDRPRLRPLVKDDCMSPVWTPDSEQLIYWCASRPGRAAGVYISDLAVGSEPTLVLASNTAWLNPTSVSPDGTHVLLNRHQGPLASGVIASLIPQSDTDSSLRVIVPEQAHEPNARFSPDGAWIAYISSNAGRPDVVLSSVDTEYRPGPVTVVSVQGGTDVIWAKTEGSRQELLYPTLSGKLMAVTIRGDSGPASSGPIQVLDLYEHDVSSERRSLALDTLPGGGYLAILLGDDERSSRLNVVLGFDEVIRRRSSAP
jgi:Tol biopolymer transport system component